MEVNIVSPGQDVPLDRAYVVSIVIKSFKGRRNVAVHLFRPDWDKSEEQQYSWDMLLDQSPQKTRSEMQQSRHVIMEAFTQDECKTLIEYLRQRYAGKLSLIDSRPLSFPVPAGLTPLGAMPENENYGRIRFDLIPNYPLSFHVHGFYDLSAHAPILAGED